MATWTGLDHTPQVLNSAEEWRTRCLTGNGSLFADGNLWTPENIAELKELFVGNPIVGDRTFYDKLSEQIDGASPQVVQLASETLWLLLLFVYERTFKAANKRGRILDIWNRSGVPSPPSPHLDEDVLRGLANPGTAFMTGIWAEYGFLLRLMEAWKGLRVEEQSSLLSGKPWELGDWVSNVEGSDVRAFRHMFLYFLYPAHYERICSRTAKKKIYAAFSSLLSSADDSYDLSPSPTSLDQSIYRIRALLQIEHGTEELDFYREPVEALWREPAKKKPPKKGETVEKKKVVRDKPFSMEEAVEDLFLDLESVEQILSVWRRKKNLIIQGPPGVGKTFAAHRLAHALMGVEASNCVEFIQFHQSYSYEDFIQGYRPTEGGFQLKDGSFYSFCRLARMNPDVEHVFIIDEINRGNLSKVFGETMMLIEADKRGPDWGIPLAYGAGDQKFSVPENIYLLGLMNTADRSLAVVDYALRRRFGFFELTPRFGSEKFRAHMQSRGVSDNLVSLLEGRIGSLNDEIAGDQSNLGRGFCIGHSYFCAPKDELLSEHEWYRQIIETEVIPLLEEYWFDAPSKVEDWRKRLLAEF